MLARKQECQEIYLEFLEILMIKFLKKPKKETLGPLFTKYGQPQFFPKDWTLFFLQIINSESHVP